MKQTTRVSFDTVIDGDDCCIEFNRTTVFSAGMENQDADGNRGQWMVSVDVDEYADVEVSIDGGEPVFTKDVAIITVVEKYMETHPPEPEEQPEPDYDDRGEDE